ncbi:hypothetical protein BSKO_12721 [Bryopsis sp. KO-2023]|nr:hypothetical protein BSKO_12721 [Bryopsis sp. KO-2023]
MAYNLYQVQMANAWVQRVEKESAIAEKFWTQQTGTQPNRRDDDNRSMVSSIPSGSSRFTSTTQMLKTRLEVLEKELRMEKEHRQTVEDDLKQLKSEWKSQTPKAKSVAGGCPK